MSSDPSQDARDVELLTGLANVHVLFGQHKTALHILELANWIDRKHVQTLLMMAQCHFNLSNPQLVISTLDRILTVNPNHHSREEEILLRARSYALLGESSDARRSLLSVLAVG